jgi:hypothetical protein
MVLKLNVPSYDSISFNPRSPFWNCDIFWEKFQWNIVQMINTNNFLQIFYHPSLIWENVCRWHWSGVERVKGPRILFLLESPSSSDDAVKKSTHHQTHIMHIFNYSMHTHTKVYNLPINVTHTEKLDFTWTKPMLGCTKARILHVPSFTIRTKLMGPRHLQLN